MKATSCDQHSAARANVWSCGAVCAVHAWSFTRSRSRFLSSRWRCRLHTCSPALAGRRGLGRHLMRLSVICCPLRSRWRRRRVSTLDSRRRRQVAACGQPQVAQALAQCATWGAGAAGTPSGLTAGRRHASISALKILGSAHEVNLNYAASGLRAVRYE